MSCARERLSQFARTEAVSYLVSLESFEPFLQGISLVLVGSVASGSCEDHSDVDVAIVSCTRIHEEVARDTAWAQGRPTEVNIRGTVLQYFGVSYAQLEDHLLAGDDNYWYNFGVGVPLWDPAGAFSNWFLSFQTKLEDTVHLKRLDERLASFRRRFRALKDCLAYGGDPVVAATIYLENIVLALKVTALIDNVQFDPRKRLFVTATSGPLGAELEAEFRYVMQSMGTFSRLGIEEISLLHCHRMMDRIYRRLAREAYEKWSISHS